MAPELLSFRSVPRRASVTQTLDPSKRAPIGPDEPTPTVNVVTVQGIEADGVMIETEPGAPPFAVQTLDPSRAMPVGLTPRLLATVVTAPAVRAGSISNRVPGFVCPATKTRLGPIASPKAFVVPVQVSSSRPSLARTRGTVPPLAIQRSAPSNSTKRGAPPIVVMPSTPGFCVVQFCLRTAPDPTRLKTASTPRDTT